MKKCTVCGLEKPCSEFGKEKRNKSGLRGDCKTCYKIKRDKWMKSNPDYFKEYHERTGYRKKKYQADREKELESNKQWRTLNREKLSLKQSKYRQLGKSLIYDYSDSLWMYTLLFFKFQCVYCGSKENLQKEHVIPFSKGGEYTIRNIVPACKSCNCSKKDKDLKDWYFKQSFFSRQRLNKLKSYLLFVSKT